MGITLSVADMFADDNRTEVAMWMEVLLAVVAIIAILYAPVYLFF
jgi:hypothetical protein